MQSMATESIPAADSTRSGSFLSLKWRALILTSLVLLGLAVMYTLLSQANLNLQFDQHREVIHERQARESAQALSSSREHLQLLGSLIPALSGMGPALLLGDRARVESSFEPQWPALQLEAGLDEVQIFAANGTALAAWGDVLNAPDPDTVPPPIARWVDQVTQQQAPFAALWCVDQCRQYVVVPLLVDGVLAGTVALSRSLGEVALNARRISGSEIGLLVDLTDNSNGVFSERHIRPWSGAVVILTGEDTVLPVLHGVATQWSLDQLRQKPRQFEWGGRSLELSALPLDTAQGSRTGHMLLISDITEQILAIRKDTRIALAVALFGWLAAELLLLGILWGPMDRLRRLSGNLPMLARGEFGPLRRAVGQPRNRVVDEIDLINLVTLDLSSQLEALQTRVRIRDRELSTRMVELGRQRDFVNCLLDTARVIIVTQDREGRISLVNAYGLSLVGRAASELRGRDFQTVFMGGAEHEANPNVLAGAMNGPRQEESALLLDRHAEPRTIAWYHAPLPQTESGDTAIISVGLDVTARKAAESRLTWLASHDPLTNLPNRRAFQDAMEAALSDPSARGAVLFLDLDEFKDVNDFSGHQTGDQLLQLVAEALDEAIGTDGMVARLGGDEFGILLCDADEPQANALAERVVRRLERVALPVSNLRHRTTASVGIALFPRHGMNARDLMASADLAMYQAKNIGPGNWHMLPTSTEIRRAVQERVYWVEYLRDALLEGRFELYAQPLLRLADNDTNYYEILVRMRGRNGELIQPNQFIPVAEQSRQIIEIDRWVLRHSLRLLQQLDRTHPKVHLAVNISAHTLHSADLFEILAEDLRNCGVNPARLTLEITETAAITDFVKARSLIGRVRELGCHFSLDDFGVGFSSFHYLRQLPASIVKIDGAFIRDLDRSADDRLLVQAMINIAHGFGKRTAAEYVGSEAILEILRGYGVTYVQGFFVGRPRPVTEIFDVDPVQQA